MKKLLVLLTMGFAIIAEPFLVQFKALNSEALIARAEASPVKSVSLDASVFDPADTESLEKLPSWNPDSLSQEAENGSVEQLNYTANGNFSLSLNDYIDIFSSFLEMDEEIDFKQTYNYSLTYLNLSDTESETYYYAAYYEHYSPIVYFDQSLLDKQNLIFYLDISFQMDDLLKLKNRFPEQLVGSLPLVIVNDEFTFLKVEFSETSCSLKTDNYARVDPVRRDPVLQNETAEKVLCMRLTIPYIESITDLKVFVGKHAADASTLPQPVGRTLFRFDQVLHDRYYFYLFDICNFSVIKKELAVDNKSYFNSGSTNVPSMPSMKAHLVSMKVHFKGSLKVKNTTIKGLAGNVNNSYYFTPISEEKVIDFDPNLGHVDGSLSYYYFNDLNLASNVSGEFKILSISFHPNVYDSRTHRYYVNEDITYTHHYENTNMHKYSFDVGKSIRVYYYKMSSYLRALSKNSNWYTWLLDFLITDRFFNYICFGFSFYFDAQRTHPIPNVKKLTVKYQRGYKEPNPKEGSNGFYPNCGDPYKDVHIRTMEVNENKVRGLGALDKEGMCLTNNASPKLMRDNDGITHDYVLYQLRERGNDPGITTMDALALTYESLEGETVSMVGNSKGLHVVVDDDGVARVYNSEGNLEEDYGVYEAEDGTKVPGKDENGDGKIDSDEVINSDTGENITLPFKMTLQVYKSL